MGSYVGFVSIADIYITDIIYNTKKYYINIIYNKYDIYILIIYKICIYIRIYIYHYISKLT